MVRRTRVARRVVHEVARSKGRPEELLGLANPSLADEATALETVAAAGYHGVLPLLWAASEASASAPTALRLAVHDAYLPLVARGLRLRHLMQAVVDTFASGRVDYVVYKGPAMATHYQSPQLRAFSDIDVLVHPDHLERADAALKSAGFVGGWSGVPDTYAETTYQLDGYGLLDLHWHLMREPKVRDAFALDPSDLISRSTTVSWEGLTLPVLDRSDHLIAVATHACFDGAYRLGWFVDMAVLLKDGDLAWAEVHDRCAATKTSLPVQVMLDRAQRAIGIPRNGRDLADEAWRRATRVLSAIRPVEKTFRQAGRGGIIYRSTRANSRASFAASWSSLVHEGLSPLIHDHNHRWRSSRDDRV